MLQKNRSRQCGVFLSTSKHKVKELPKGGATLASETGGEGFGTGADGFFSSGDTFKYKMPKIIIKKTIWSIKTDGRTDSIQK